MFGIFHDVFQAKNVSNYGLKYFMKRVKNISQCF